MAAEHPFRDRIFEKLGHGESEPFAIESPDMALLQKALLAHKGVELAHAVRATCDCAAVLANEGAKTAALALLEMATTATPELKLLDSELAREAESHVHSVAQALGRETAHLIGTARVDTVVPGAAPRDEAAVATIAERLARLIPKGRPTTSIAPQFWLPEDAGASAKRGAELASALRYKDAIAAFEQALSEDDDQIAVWCSLAELHLSELHWPETVRAIERCAELDPHIEHPCGVRARALATKAMKSVRAS